MQDVIHAINGLQQPFWFTIIQVIGILIPILLTVLIFLQNSKHKEDNERLQLEIAKRNEVNNLYALRLNVYQTYIETYSIMYNGAYDSLLALGFGELVVELYEKTVSHLSKLDIALNSTNLLFGQDQSLHCYLKNINTKYRAYLDAYLRTFDAQVKIVKENRLLAECTTQEKVKQEYALLTEMVQQRADAVKELLVADEFEKIFQKYFRVD